MKTLRFAVRVCSVLLITAIGLHGQAAPGVFADANNPAGAPDPEKLDQIWQVDPISGQVSINIPFTTIPQGGRGPKIPFKLLYNSGSTLTLQGDGTYLIPIYGGNVTLTDLKWSPSPLGTMGPNPGPPGPWVTSGPYFTSVLSNVPDSGYNPGDHKYSLLGCQIWGPYSYADEYGAVHDAGLENYYPGPLNGDVAENGASVNPICVTARQGVAWSTGSTNDGSAMLTSDGIAIGPYGTRFTSGGSTGYGYPQHTLTDTNGNSASITINNGIATATDALGRTVFITNIPIGQPDQIPAGSYYVTTHGTSGNQETYNITVSTTYMNQYGTLTMPHPANYTEACYGGCSGNLSIIPPDQNASFLAVTQISLPDGTSYGFQYDPTYGTISEITFPTGGHVRFSWAIRPYSWIPYGVYSAISDLVVTDVYTSTGGNENHWSYDLLSQDPATTWNIPTGTYSTVYAPDGSKTTYSYTSRIDGSSGCFTYARYPSGGYTGALARLSCKPASTATYDASGNLLNTVDQTFTWDGLPIRTVTTLYGNGIGASAQKQELNTYGQWDNVTEKDESDYYSCSGTPCAIPSTWPTWIRSTFTSYAYTTNQALANAHIVNKPSQVTITDRNGNPVALTSYGYDNLGNLLTESKCLSISGTGSSASCVGSSWQTQYSYDSTGQLSCKVDGLGLGSNRVGSCSAGGLATTSYAWGGQANGFLLGVTHANGRTDSYTYYTPTGQLASHTDWNGNTTSYYYSDPLNRPTSIVAPQTTDGTTGSNGQGTTTYSYTDTPGAFSIQEQHSVNTLGTQTSTTTYFDGLGRKITTRTVTPQCSSPIEVDTAYDSMSRVYTVSNPYCTTSDPTYGQTTFTYDALGRKTQTTFPGPAVSTISYSGNATEFTDPANSAGNPQHIQQVNGLGQLTSVCEVAASAFGGASPVSCGLNISGSGYPTSYAYDPLGNLLNVNQHGVSRSFTYDRLSRLTQSVNPETGSFTYTYSTPSAPCSPDPSVPCSKADLRGVTISYGYDNLSRLLSKTYSGNASGTPISCYQYDTSSISGSGGNLVGHLTNAWTQAASSSCNSSLTSFINLKSFLHYDAVGRLLSAQQQTCVGGTCSGPTPYQVSMTYDLAGNATTLTNSVGANNQPLTLTNYFDSASRPCLTTSDWTANASPNLFQVSPTPSSTSPGYSPAGGLQNYFLGSPGSTASSSCSSTPTSPINAVLNYTKRFWVGRISATGQIP